MFNFNYGALIHGKWKAGVCEHVKPRFKTYNKGNFKFAPAFLYVVDEGHEEQSKILEDKVLSKLYDFLENPNFLNDPTEYVNPEFDFIDGDYLDELMKQIIIDNNFKFHKVKPEYITESIKDVKFLENIRLFPSKYLEQV